VSNREHLILCLLYLMHREIECLRSVLSEFDGDKSEFTQMMVANDLQRVRESMEHKL
jgi:hypothetical protein